MGGVSWGAGATGRRGVGTGGECKHAFPLGNLAASSQRRGKAPRKERTEEVSAKMLLHWQFVCNNSKERGIHWSCFMSGECQHTGRGERRGSWGQEGQDSKQEIGFDVVWVEGGS